jgi:hypothetical protein
MSKVPSSSLEGAVLEGAMYNVNMKRFMVFSKLVSHDGGKIASAN